MASEKTIQVSFAGGIISPQMFGRKDDLKYQNGLEECENFVVLPQGPIRNRPGFEFVNECGDESHPVRLIPFTYSAGQTMVIELGHRYARFHSFGGTLVNDDETPYQITTPWDGDDVFDLVYVQSGDVVTVVSGSYPPYEICRYGARDWRIVQVTGASSLPVPTGVTAVRATAAATDSNADKYTQKYRVSCLNWDKSEESEASGVVSVVANLYASGTTVRVSCDSMSGASFYRFYKNKGGLYAYIGDSETPEIIDDNIAPRTDVTVRRTTNPFASNNFPRAVGYFEQRKIFAGFSKDPQRVVMTRTGTEADFTYSLPYVADDRISFQMASREFSAIQHIVSLTGLIALSSSMAYRLASQDSGAISPSSITCKPQTNTGASRVMPQIVGNTCLYCDARGGHVREMGYQYQAGGYITQDLCLRSSHLFDFKTISDSALMLSPVPVVWYVNDDGELLGMTYIPEQEVAAWHRHTTDGAFESVACVEEGTEDHVYVVVVRRINGQYRRYIERMASMKTEDIRESFFVDSGATYSGAPVTRITGLDWLEGRTVAILADGAVLPQQTVENGAITLENPASYVVVGLPYEANAQTLPIAMQQSQSLGGGRMKNVIQSHVRVWRSSGIFVGPRFDKLVEYKHRTTEPMGAPPELKTEEINLHLPPTWQNGGQICIRQSNPLPLSVQSIVLTVSM